MNLLALPLSTSLSDVERIIVQAFIRNSGGLRRPYADVYRHLAQSLHLKVAEVKSIERAMIGRVGGAYEAHPIAVASDNDAMVHDYCTQEQVA